ncbi:cytochrome P450 [Ramlibacter sp.]|uniref:cytochrome P450 n=1 Tax=Ramlibacter sp. TaxID=1917967 RepID=UPI0017A1DDDC|nr:cytochrome P450 [Ramlibacter sp.]MBA2673344.1 cytochrome P450 [Ramlibacter sp.]
MSRVLFNPFSERFRADPYETYAALRREPAFRALGMVVVTRHPEVKAVLRDRRFSSALIPMLVERRLQEFGMRCPEVSELGKKAIVFTDPPDHSRLRRLANRTFNEQGLQSLRPMAAQLARDHLDRYAREGGDFVRSVSRPLPLKLLLSWMDIDFGHMETVAALNHDVRYFLEPGVVTREQFAHVYDSLKQFLDFFRGYVAPRGERPGDDFISLLLAPAGAQDGFTPEEVAYMCVMAFVAGAETTQALLGTALFLLASHPAEYGKLLSGAVSAGQAAQEILRFEAPLQMTKRLALEDMEVAGVAVRAQEQVLLCLGAANHDADVFAAADTFDLGRGDSRQHLGFGYGAHACLGATLAEMQLEVLLEELVRRQLPLAVLEPPRWQKQSLIIRGLQSLLLDTCSWETALEHHR